MGWDLDAGYGCGEELKNLEHLFLNCPLLSEGRPGFFGFWPADSPACLLTNLTIKNLCSALTRAL